MNEKIDYDSLTKDLLDIDEDKRIPINRPGVQVVSDSKRVNERPWQYTPLAIELREKIRGIRAKAIGDLDRLLYKAVHQLELNGCEVYIAKNKDDARKYASEVIGDADLIVKAKTASADEIDLRKFLEESGKRVIETDLAMRILQLIESEGWMPSDPILPAIHVPIEVIAEAFTKDLGKKVEPTHESIFTAARSSLRNYFFNAQVGISGSNSISADDGLLWLVEYEGNIRHVTNAPITHLAVAGVDKIVPTAEDSFHIIRGLVKLVMSSRKMGGYISMIGGPSRSSDVQGIVRLGIHGPKNVHVLLLDNGRFEMIDEGFGEALYCIHCGVCLATCPLYYNLCWNFAWKDYVCAWGIIHSAFAEGIETAIKQGLFYCTQCGTCHQVCSAMIDWPTLIEKLRAKAVKAGYVLPPYSTMRENIINTGNPFGVSSEQRFKL